MSEDFRSEILHPENLLRLEPEELAQLVLTMLQHRTNQEDGEISRCNFTHEFRQYYGNYPSLNGPKIMQAMRAIMEAWNWMVTHGLIAPSPQHNTGNIEFLTRAAWRLKTKEDFDNFRKASIWSPQLLHPIIAEKAWQTFIRGKHDTAVFEAFKEVEIAVRAAGGYGPRMIGVDLMRTAFHPETGNLTDKSLPPSEREALAALFAGAIGSYKNPTSHRTVVIDDATEAGEMLSLASHLLRIVDARAALREQKAAL